MLVVLNRLDFPEKTVRGKCPFGAPQRAPKAYKTLQNRDLSSMNMLALLLTLLDSEDGEKGENETITNSWSRHRGKIDDAVGVEVEGFRPTAKPFLSDRLA